MKIVIDARMYNESGIGRYIRNLIFNLQELDTKNQYFILLLQKDLHRSNFQKNFTKICADFKWYGLTEQVRLPGLLKSLNPDLVHFPHFNVPLFYQGKFVVTIHDLIHQHFSMQRATTHGSLVYKLKQFGYKKVFNNAIKKSQKILVPSDYVKKQLINNYQINSDKIVTTPEAVDNNLSQVKATKKIDQPYIFYVGNAHPHKNVEGLIKAYLVLKEKYKTLKLVLAGGEHYFWQKIRKEYPFSDIIYVGNVSDEELVGFYKNAKCFVMPSFEEGFGIPILEAMSFSCPVVSSNAGSLSEVGGDACLYFDPGDKEDMADKIDMVLKSEEKRKELVVKGLTRIKQFSWKKLAEQTLEAYKECV